MKKNNDIQPSTPCNCMNIRRAARVVTSFYDRSLADSGLSITQMGILNVLSNFQPQGISELAEKLNTDRTTMNRNLKPLMENGFIECKQGKDARKKELYVTEKGIGALQIAAIGWTKAQKAMLELVGEERLFAFNQTLAMLENMQL